MLTTTNLEHLTGHAIQDTFVKLHNTWPLPCLDAFFQQWSRMATTANDEPVGTKHLAQLESLNLTGWTEVDWVAFWRRVFNFLPHLNGLITLRRDEAAACLVKAGGEDTAL